MSCPPRVVTASKSLLAIAAKSVGHETTAPRRTRGRYEGRRGQCAVLHAEARESEPAKTNKGSPGAGPFRAGRVLRVPGSGTEQ